MNTFKTTLIFSFFSLLCFSARSADNNMLVELLKDDKINSAYNDCKNNENKGKDNLENCIWDSLDEQKREEVKKKMELSKQAEAGSKDNKVKYESLSLAPTKDKKDSAADTSKDQKKKDPEIAKLEEFLAKRLGESLYGDINTEQQKNNPSKVVDHKVFYDLYEAQVSKNVISAISSYCIEAKLDDDKRYLISQDKKTREAQRTKNIESLKNNDLEKDNEQSEDINKNTNDKTELENTTNKAAKHWNGCAQNIQNICVGKELYDTEKHPSLTKSTDYKYSKDRACVVTKLIKDARQSLIKVGQIKKVLEENANESGRGLQGKKEIEVYSGSKDKQTKSIDDLTSITSSELAKSGFGEGIKEKQKLFDKCAEASSAEDPACKNILLSGKEAEDEQKKLNEYALRTKVLEEKLSDKKTMTKEEVSDYLKEQGYSEEDIKKMVEKDLESLRKEIAKHYTEEKNAINRELQDRLKKITLKKDTEDPKEKQSQITKLAEELESKPEQYKQLIHYNNIVQGFLELGNKQKNTASIARELESNEGLSEEEIKKREELKTSLQNQGVKMDDDGQGKDAVKIEIESINKKLLKYDADATPTPGPTSSN